MNKYGVLLIGGMRTHQPNYAPAFAADPRCRLVAVTCEPDMDEERTAHYRQFAEHLNLPYISDLHQALQRADVHIVSSTPAIEQRGQVVVRCLDAGKHVYLDKPLAASMEDADAIVSASKRSSGRTQMFTFNTAAWVQRAKQAINAGHVGQVKAIHAETLFAKGRAGTAGKTASRVEHPTRSRYTFVEAKREMFDLSVYSLAAISALTDLEAQSVVGHTGNYIFAEHVGVDVEDVGALAITLRGGVTATALGGRFGWTSHPKAGPLRIVVIGTKATLTFDAYQPRIEIYNDEPDFTMPPVDPLDPMGMWRPSNPRYAPNPKRRWVALTESENVAAMDVAAFIDCIEEERQPSMDAQAAALNLEIVLAGYISASRNESVRLPLPRTSRRDDLDI